jgi:tRNA threonylcarbamoyladenosine biosynthesis protein TsaE
VSALESSSPEETRRLGEALGRAAEAGDVILLSGELGAGKTVFVQGMARGLDFQGPVSSKSFVLLGEYVGRITLFHADLYRLESPAEVEDLALEEISRDGVLVVEWPERGEVALPGERLTLRFEVSGPETRRITAEATGARARALAEALGK